MSDSRAHSAFIFGLGYTGSRLAERLQGQGWRVAGTVSSEEGVRWLRARGIQAHRFADGTLAEAALPELKGAACILSSIPPQEGSDIVLPLLHRTLDRDAGARWLGYLSTTGVYGDRQGSWVDETAPPAPGSARARHRVGAEAGWEALAQELVATCAVFRIAGIYGPGRNALEALQAGTARRIVKPGQVFSRIHVDDLVTVLSAAMAQPDTGGVFNLADDLPASTAEVVEYAAGLLQRPPPPVEAFESAELSPMARSFYAECRRVSNRRIKDVLGVTLAYPTYREGLQALLRAL